MYKMEKIVINLVILKLKKIKFHQHKGTIWIKIIDNNKIEVSNKLSFRKKGFKYFIGYKDPKIRPLCIFLPKKSAYRKEFDGTKHMSFLIKDDKLLKKYNEICEKVSRKNLIVNQYTIKISKN